MAGNLNRGAKLSDTTIARITAAALARNPVTRTTRALISANSAKAELFAVSTLNEPRLPITLRTIPNVVAYVGCSEKTIRRALGGKGIVKGK